MICLHWMSLDLKLSNVQRLFWWGSFVGEVWRITRIFTESEKERNNDSLWSPVCWCAALCVSSCKLPLLWLLQCVNQQKCKQDEFWRIATLRVRDDGTALSFAPLPDPSQTDYLSSRRRQRTPSQKEKWRLLEAETDFSCFGSICSVELEKVENSKLALKELKP